MVGRKDVLVENHNGILHCGREKIQLMTQAGVLLVVGSELVLREVATGRAYIGGQIDRMEYSALEQK